MKIVVLAGSPHKNGTSNTLVNEFIKGATEIGKKVELIDLAHINIHPCLGCNHCGMNGNCIQNDIGNEILDKILQADALIFVSPVYYYNISSQLKIMIDRFYAKTMQITNKRLKAGVIMTAWNNNDWTYEAIEKYFDILFDYMHFKKIKYIFGKGCQTVSMIPKKYYIDAYNMGKDI